MSSISTSTLPSTHRVFIPHTSWALSRFWWITRINKPFSNSTLLKYLFPPPVPLKGQQIWPSPPPLKLINSAMGRGEGDQAVVGQWKEEESGWVMTMVGPPPGPAGTTVKETERVVLYFHGSCFQFGPLDVHWGWAGYLARELNAEVILVPYPLAPTNNAFEVLPVLTRMYASLLKRAGDREVIIGGDSAGGALALNLTHTAHQAGLAPPSQVISISPMVNLPHDNPAMIPLERTDNLLSQSFLRRGALLWAGLSPSVSSIPQHILSDPSLNPSAINLQKIFVDQGVRLILSSGTYEVLHADVLPFAEKAEREGVDVTFIEGEHCQHCFPVLVAAGVAPECKSGAEAVVKQVLANGKRA